MTYFGNNVCATRARATATDPGEAYPELLPDLDETGYASHFQLDHPGITSMASSATFSVVLKAAFAVL
jgi:hypothetical protein